MGTSHLHLTIIGDDDDDNDDDDPPFPFILSPINQTTSVRVPKSQMPPLDGEDVRGVAIEDDVKAGGDDVGAEKWPPRSRSGWAFEGVPLKMVRGSV